MGNLGYQAHGVVVVGTPSTMILQEATTLRSDLILMGTRGRQGITRFVLGSVSHKVAMLGAGVSLRRWAAFL